LSLEPQFGVASRELIASRRSAGLSKSLLPLVRGRRWPTRRTRGLARFSGRRFSHRAVVHPPNVSLANPLSCSAFPNHAESSFCRKREIFVESRDCPFHDPPAQTDLYFVTSTISGEDN